MGVHCDATTGGVDMVDAGRFLAARDELAEVYRAVFCAPPWSEPLERVAAFADRLEADTARAGFTATWARVGSSLAGFAYGFTTVHPFPDHGCYGSVRAGLGPDVDRLSGTFEVVELAVRPEHRGGGIGRALLTTLTAGRPAWLLTSVQISSAVDFYEHLGWCRRSAADDLVVFTNRSRLPGSRRARTARADAVHQGAGAGRITPPRVARSG